MARALRTAATLGRIARKGIKQGIKAGKKSQTYQDIKRGYKGTKKALQKGKSFITAKGKQARAYAKGQISAGKSIAKAGMKAARAGYKSGKASLMKLGDSDKYVETTRGRNSATKPRSTVDSADRIKSTPRMRKQDMVNMGWDTLASSKPSKKTSKKKPSGKKVAPAWGVQTGNLIEF